MHSPKVNEDAISPARGAHLVLEVDATELEAALAAHRVALQLPAPAQAMQVYAGQREKRQSWVIFIAVKYVLPALPRGFVVGTLQCIEHLIELVA